MRDLVLDVWQELRDKHLWPVAAVLAVALVGVPVLLLKGAPEAPKPVTASPSDASLPLVTSDQTSIAGSSNLGAFDPKDPFRSLAKAPRTGQVGPAAGATAPDAALGGGLGVADTGGDPPAGASSAGGGGAPDSAGSPAGGSPSGSPTGRGSAQPSTPSSGSGSGSGSPTPSPAPSPAEPRFYQYALELDFGRIGAERRYNDVRALDMLPNERDPVVVYLGQTRENESSFLVNQGFDATGNKKNEGTCLPNKTDCSFVYLRADSSQNDHYFTERPGGKDRVFHLHLIAVKRKLDSRDPSASASAKSSDRRGRSFGKRSKGATRRTYFDFRIPLIAGQRR